MFEILLVLAVLLLLIPVLAGLGYGLSALRTTRDHPNAPSLRLAGLNLLEPSVTIAVGLVSLAVFALGASGIFFTGSGINSLPIALVTPLIAGFPLSLMLLAPFFASPTLPFRNEIVMWGRWRWINTVLLWITCVLAASSDTFGIGIVGMFVMVISGIVILWVSILKIVAIVRELEGVAKV